MQDFFGEFHPVVVFCYFAAVMIFNMVFMHPVLLIISFACASFYALWLDMRKAISFILKFCLPVLVLWAVINLFTNSRGQNIFLYVNDRPLTVESLIYGLMSGLMFVNVMLWFFCYNRVVTTDKFLYLFGKTLPSLALLISMALSFVPRLTSRAKDISNARKGIGKSTGQGSVKKRASNGGAILMTLTTWSLENAMITADSMNARGYGTTKRTRFSVYKLSRREKIIVPILLAVLVLVISGMIFGFADIEYFPEIISSKPVSVTSMVFFICFTFLCIFPFLYNVLEVVRWQFLKSKI